MIRNKTKNMSGLIALTLAILTAFILFSSSASAANVTLTKAKSVALKHAGLKAVDVTFTKTKTDYDDGEKEYEIEFYSSKAEYDYEISASTGKITSYEKENFKVEKTADSSKSGNTTSGITLAKAKSIALEHAGLKASEVTFVKAKVDYDDGIKEYEIEFYHESVEYDYDIDASTGKILGFDKDIENYRIK